MAVMTLGAIMSFCWKSICTFYNLLTKGFLETGITTLRSGFFDPDDPPELLELFNACEFREVLIPGLGAPVLKYN